MAVALRTTEGSISSKLLLSETYHYENPWKLTRVEMSSHVVFPTVGAFRGTIMRVGSGITNYFLYGWDYERGRITCREGRITWDSKRVDNGKVCSHCGRTL